MKSRKFLGIIIATILLLGLVVSEQIFSRPVGKELTNLLMPVGIVFSNTGQRIGGFFSNLLHIGTLQKENTALTNKLDSALSELARLSEAKKENDSLRLDLGFKQSSGLDLVPADVAYFDPGLRDGITVKVADNSGIAIGNPVLSQGYLVGRVSNIDKNSIKILLITDSTSSMPATLQNKNITGIAKGKIGNGLAMEQVPQSDNVVRGDTVITSGLGGEFPKGLILGKVDEVKKVSGSIFQNVALQPMVEFSKLERVMIAR